MAENNNKDLIRLFPDRHSTDKRYMFALWDRRIGSPNYNDGDKATDGISSVFAKLAYAEFAKLSGKKIIASEIAKIFIEATQSNKEYLIVIPTTVTIINAKKMQDNIDAFIDADNDWMVAGHLGEQSIQAFVYNQKTYWRSLDGEEREEDPMINIQERFGYLYENPFIINIAKYKLHGTYEFGERSSLMTSLIKQKINDNVMTGHPDKIEQDTAEDQQYQFWADIYDLPVDVHGWSLIHNCVQTDQKVISLTTNIRSAYYSSYWPVHDSFIHDINSKAQASTEAMRSILSMDNRKAWLAETKTQAMSKDPIDACSDDQQEYLGILHDYANMKENWGIGSLKPQWSGGTDTAMLGTDEFTAISNLQQLVDLPNFDRIISVANGLNVCRFMDNLDFTNVKEIFWISGSHKAMDFQRQLVAEIQSRVKADTLSDFNYGTFYNTWLGNNSSWIGDYAGVQDILDDTLNMSESYVNDSNLAVIGDANISHKFVSFSYSPMNLAPMLKLMFKENSSLENVFIDFDDMFISPYYMLSCVKTQPDYLQGKNDNTRRDNDLDQGNRYRPEIEFNDVIYYLGQQANRKRFDVEKDFTIYLHCFWPGTYTGINTQLY